MHSRAAKQAAPKSAAITPKGKTRARNNEMKIKRQSSSPCLTNFQRPANQSEWKI